MRMCGFRFLSALLIVTAAGLAQARPASGANDPLPSWNDGPAKSAIISFVEKTTHDGSPDFIPPDQRIAVFDNDGTLWCEQPAYFQLLFAIDRVKALAPQHPEWKDQEPFKSVLEGNIKELTASGYKGILEVVNATHTGMSIPQFEAVVKDWLKTARHPRTGKPYTEMIYQPMVEVLKYFRANGYKTFIVSGGGVDFMRTFAENTYGIPPEQTVGSRGNYKFEMHDGKAEVMKDPGINLIDDGPGKPVGIAQVIGRRPVAAFGNSDGDLQMLQYVTTRTGPSLGVILHHTDAVREYAYDRDSEFGRLDKALDLAKKNGWTVIDMKRDWKTVFPGD